MEKHNKTINIRASRKRPLVQAIGLALALSVQAAHAGSGRSLIEVKWDGVGANPGNINGANCTLQAAIVAANTDQGYIHPAGGNCPGGQGADLIDLSAIAGKTVTLDGESLNITSNILIEGNGVKVVGDTADAYRVLKVSSVSANAIINDMIITGGNANSYYGGYDGGGIYVGSNGAQLTLNRTSVYGNTAIDSGGGIMARNDSTVTISNSTISGNTASTAGGVLLFDGPGMTMNNSTISGNNGGSNGGGIRLRDATATLNHVTVANNTATYGASVFIEMSSSGNPKLTMNNSVLANGVGADECDFYGPSYSYADQQFTFEGVNLIEGGSSNCNLSASATLLTDDPQLVPLAKNGGPTLTHLPFPGGPVIDAGDNGSVPPGLEFDQRGAGFFRIHGDHTDLGSIEFQPDLQSGPDFVVTSKNDTNDGICAPDPGHCSLTEAIDAANSDIDSSTITFIAHLLQSPDFLTTSKRYTISSSVTIQGGGKTLDAQNLWGHFLVQNAGQLTLRNLTLSNGGNNVQPAYCGGAIRVEDSDLELERVSIVNANAQNGAGLCVSLGNVNISESTFSGNTATGKGGAIYSDVSGGVRVTNSSLSGNSAIAGGAVFVSYGGFTLTSSTLSGNSAITGGGLYTKSSGVVLSNSIIAGANAAIVPHDDCYQWKDSVISTISPNIVENKFNCIFSGVQPLEVNPLLGPLADNGGPTLTHLPLPGSPAIDAGDNSAVPGGLEFDQRGAGFARIVSGTVDIGSVEVQAAPTEVIFEDSFEQ